MTGATLALRFEEILAFQALPCRQITPPALMVCLLPVEVGLSRLPEFVRRRAV